MTSSSALGPPALGPTLLVGGQAYAGWTRVSVRTSLEHMAGAFVIQVTERWSVGTRPALRPGLQCVLKLGQETVITGWIDSLSRDLGPEDHTVQISGRDASADLVDCSAVVRQYQGQTLDAIARDQCAPYQVGVASRGDLGGPFKRVASEPGQSVWEFLEQLARQRGVLLLPDGQGGLILGAPSFADCPTALVEGANLLGVRALADWRDRYSEVIVRGQSAGSDDWYGKPAAEIEARAPDAAVSRHRPLIVMAEDGEADLQARADWEQRTRYGRALTVQAGVQGWECQPGRLWRMGELVRVQAPTVGVTETLLIVGADYDLDNRRGTTTDLHLSRREAFEPGAPQPEADEDAAAGWWS